MSKYRELDLSGVTRFPFAERPTKVDVSMFGRPRLDDDSFAAFLASLPDVLVAADFKHVAARTAQILREGRERRRRRPRLEQRRQRRHLQRAGAEGLDLEAQPRQLRRAALKLRLRPFALGDVHNEGDSVRLPLEFCRAKETPIS